MKKRQKPPSGKYRKPVFYLEDLEEIVEIISNVSDKVSIEYGDCEYESLDELLGNNLPDRINGLRIMGKPHYTPRIDLTDEFLLGGSLEVSSNDDASIAAFHKIDAILRRAERVCFLDKLMWWWFNVALVLSASGLWIGSYANEAPEFVIPPLLLFLIWTALVVWRLTQKTWVYLQRRHQRKSFFQRNWETLAVNLLVAFVSGVAVLLVQKMYVEPSSTSAVEAPAPTLAPSDSNSAPDK